MNLQKGGEITLANGKKFTVPPHSCRIFGELWGNGAFIEVLFYNEKQDGAPESDRIHLLITPDTTERRGFLMSVEDAMVIISGLTLAVRCALECDVPTHG